MSKMFVNLYMQVNVIDRGNNHSFTGYQILTQFLP